MPIVGVNGAAQDSWGDCCSMDRSQKMCLAISVALIAVAAVATYYCLVHGLKSYDLATTSLSKFGAGFLIYSGVAFSVVAVANTVYLGCKLLCNDGKKFEYEPTEAKIQVAASILAPIAVIPVAIVGALGIAFSKK